MFLVAIVIVVFGDAADDEEEDSSDADGAAFVCRSSKAVVEGVRCRSDVCIAF
jgi:hypothetical protein